MQQLKFKWSFSHCLNHIIPFAMQYENFTHKLREYHIVEQHVSVIYNSQDSGMIVWRMKCFNE